MNSDFPLIWQVSHACIAQFWIPFQSSRKTSKVDFFAKIVKGFQSWPIFGKISILDVWKGSEYASDIPAVKSLTSI